MSRKITIKIYIVGAVLTALILIAMILPSILGGEQPVMKTMERIPDKDIPTPVYIWLDADRESEGYGAFYSEGYIYLAARLGQRPTGGYAVFLGDGELTGNQVTVRVQYKSPKPWDMVTQVITYPRTVVKMQSPDELDTALFVSAGDSVIAKVSIVNLDEEPGGE